MLEKSQQLSGICGASRFDQQGSVFTHQPLQSRAELCVGAHAEKHIHRDG